MLLVVSLRNRKLITETTRMLVSHKGYAKSTQLNLSVVTDNFFILFLTLQNQIEENKRKNSDASEKF